MQNINYNIIFNNTIDGLKSLPVKPKLLLHACCAPCSSYVLKLLCGVFDVSVLFYNPNIFPQTEHDRRFYELMDMVLQKHPDISILSAPYSPDAFDDAVQGLESLPEGSLRCFECYKLRLGFAADYAKNNGFDYFTTTLSISPHKNSQMLNKLGDEAAKIHKINYLFSDFKKGGGYAQSVSLAKEYNLYRQDYCGCKYSLKNKQAKL